jgi:hypothetical protein
MRATAVLSVHLHTRRAALVEREQAGASSLHSGGMPHPYRNGEKLPVTT